MNAASFGKCKLRFEAMPTTNQRLVGSFDVQNYPGKFDFGANAVKSRHYGSKN